jgi:hypothetical protein
MIVGSQLVVILTNFKQHACNSNRDMRMFENICESNISLSKVSLSRVNA